VSAERQAESGSAGAKRDPGVLLSATELIEAALAEDLGPGDVTSDSVVPADARARARIIQKAPGVLHGLGLAAEVFERTGAESFDKLVVEGQWRDGVPAEVALVGGPARAILAGERTALNFLAHLSGIATLTARYVEAVRGTRASILDTRKTTPGLRALEKAAVAAGGGANHRAGLYDAILIKENHAALAGGVGAAVERARAAHPELEVEVECRDLDEVREGLAAGADRLLLDNMDADGLRAAVAERDSSGSEARLEASGGITLANVASVAATGVEEISIGALTHSAPALDLSLLLEPA
jgi:nicotinate-nucleotide pyrophosphorylase (carboxylating)